MKIKFITVIIILSVFSLLISANASSEDQNLDKMELVAENNYLELHVNRDDTSVAVRDKKSGSVWFSNPEKWNMREKRARGSVKNRLGSQLNLRIYTPDEDNYNTDNYNDSIDLGQFQIEDLDQGIQINYTIGKEWDDEDYLPMMLDEKRFEEMLEYIDSSMDRDFFRDNYAVLEFKEVEEEEQIEISGLDINKLFGDYKMTLVGEEDDRGALEDQYWNLLKKIVEIRSDIDEVTDLTFEDLEKIKGQRIYLLKEIPPFYVKDMVKIIKETDFNPESAAAGYDELNLEPPHPRIQVFDIPVRYYLDGPNLIAEIPCDQIEYPENVTRPDDDRKLTYPINKIKFLPYFGAAGNQEDGYLFVPDGSGALINFNNERDNIQSYNRSLYGDDYGEPRAKKKVLVENLGLPVYGHKFEDKAFVGIIEEGDAHASIEASIAGRETSFNSVSPVFTVRPRGKVTLNSQEDMVEKFEHAGGQINVFQSEMYQGKIKIRYGFLNKQDVSYVDMANYYRQYLIDKHNLEKLDNDRDQPFFLELVGGVPLNKSVMGIPRKVISPMTDFEEAREITDIFLEMGINNLNIKYDGWLEGGVEHIFPSEIKVESSLGGRDKFEEFVQYLNEEDIGFYPAVDFINVYQNSLFDDFRFLSDVSRYITSHPAKRSKYDLATYQRDRFNYLLSPREFDSVTDSFLKKYADFDNQEIALTSLGSMLYTDFKDEPELLVDRQQALKKMKDQLTKIKENNLKTVLNGSNGYIIPYSDYILNIPESSSGYDLIDKDIPFYQIVLRGLVNFAGDPLNLAEDYDYSLLKTVETGGMLYYKLYYDDPTVLKNSRFDHLYSSNYQLWLDNIEENYNQINKHLQDVQFQKIIDHQEVVDNAFITTFAGGKKVIVNYNEDQVSIDGHTVAGRNFKFLEGDE